MKIGIQVGALLASLAFAAPAGAAVQIGDATATANASAGSNTYIATQQAAGPSYVSPVDGIITSVSVKASNTTNAGFIRVQVFHPTGVAQYTASVWQEIEIPQSALGEATLHSASTWLPIRAGEAIGMAMLGDNTFGAFTSAAGFVTSLSSGTFAAGAAFNPTPALTDRRPLIAATIEPDPVDDVPAAPPPIVQETIISQPVVQQLIASGPRLCKVPRLLRATYKQASAKLLAAGCALGKRRGSKSKRARVSTQSVPAGTRVVAGTKISLRLKKR